MKKIAFTLLLSLASSIGFSQKAADFQSFNPRFEVFELPGGTLGNSVQGIVQDSTGFLWFASKEGLTRYDGQNFFTYRHDPLNPNSLSSDYVEWIFIDSKGLFWLAHYYAFGFTTFDPANEKFTRYQPDPNNPEATGSKDIMTIVEDRQGYIWLGGSGGLDRFDRKTGKFKHFRHDPADPHSLSYNYVWKLYVDKQGTLWAGTGYIWEADQVLKFGGLNRYDPKTETFTRYLHDPADPTSLADNHVRSMLEDSKGNFWVGTGGDGLHLMNREKGTFIRLKNDPKDPSKLGAPLLAGFPLSAQSPYNHVTSIFEDQDGHIWITAAAGGLNVFNPTTNSMKHFEPTEGEGNLTTEFLWQTFQTKDGSIFIPCSGGGRTVFQVKKRNELFPFFKMPVFQDVEDAVAGIVKDKAGNIWIGCTDHNPLIRYDPKTGNAFPVKSKDPSPGGFNANWVSSLTLDRKGFLWVATENGLFRLDPKTEKFKHFKPEFPNTAADTNWYALALFPDSKGYIWIPVWRKGLCRLDPKTGEFTSYLHNPDDPGSIAGNVAWAVYEDAGGNLWAGGGDANNYLGDPLFLDRFDLTTSTFTHFIQEKEVGSARSINGDSDGNIWFIDAVNGIQKLNPADGKRQKFTPANSTLSSRTLLSIGRGGNGRFWLNSKNTVQELDPESGQFFTYGEKHGVHTGSMNSEIHVATDGEILIVGDKGFIAFYPEDIARQKNNRPPDVRITWFKLNYALLTPGEGFLLEKPIWQTSSLQLEHDQNVFSFSVACFDFADPASNQLLFMLEGYDKGWRKDLRDGETPAYVNVPPGEYTFRVRGADSHGVWNEEGVSLRISISPPWWKTWWAYTIYGLLFLTAIYFFDRYQRRRIIQQERRRTLEMEAAQKQEIEKAYTALGVAHENLKATQSQLIQSEKLASLGELTAGIAHEIQNPLNFVNNFSELSVDLAEELKLEIGKLEIPSQDKEYVGEILGDLSQNQQKINHHGKRAAAIVTGMLQHARTSTGKKESTDLNALADEYLRLSYYGLRAKDASFNAQMVTDFDPAIGVVDVIPQDIGRVFLNIINNAFYATQQRQRQLSESSQISESYAPTVSISSKRTDGGVEFRIKDNGTGIPDDVKARIFQPFFTTKPTGQGTGLGLSLAYDIVVKGHGGTLDVESDEGEGTEFVVQLPTKSTPNKQGIN